MCDSVDGSGAGDRAGTHDARVWFSGSRLGSIGEVQLIRLKRSARRPNELPPTDAIGGHRN